MNFLGVHLGTHDCTCAFNEHLKFPSGQISCLPTLFLTVYNSECYEQNEVIITFWHRGCMMSFT